MANPHSPDVTPAAGATVNAAQLGVAGTIDVLRRMLAERFELSEATSLSNPDEPLFAIGVGLTSLEGVEFLCEIERQFNLRITDLDWWVYETPTLTAVAEYLVELSKKRDASG